MPITTLLPTSIVTYTEYGLYGGIADPNPTTRAPLASDVSDLATSLEDPQTAIMNLEVGEVSILFDWDHGLIPNGSTIEEIWIRGYASAIMEYAPNYIWYNGVDVYGNAVDGQALSFFESIYAPFPEWQLFEWQIHYTGWPGDDAALFKQNFRFGFFLQNVFDPMGWGYSFCTKFWADISWTPWNPSNYLNPHPYLNTNVRCGIPTGW